MPIFAANLTMLFNEVPFLDRFAKAAHCGFTAVEYLFPYPYDAEVLAQKLRENSLTQALFNLPAGDWDKGQRGLACLPDSVAAFEDSIALGIHYAKALGNTRIHAMAGIAPTHVACDVLEATYKANICKAAKMLGEHGLTLCIEPINHRSIPGYFLHRLDQAAASIAACTAEGLHNVRLLFDIFHVQMEEGCVALKMREYFSITEHYQIAGVPDRHEPDTGEIHYPYLFQLMDELGYNGYVGCEYNPKGDTTTGLQWFASYK